MWEARASLNRCIEVIHSKELKQNYCDHDIYESVPAVFAKLSWNFHPSLSSCSTLAANRQSITGMSIYYRNMSGLCPVLMDCIWKNRVLLAAFWDKISIFSFGPKGAPLCLGESHVVVMSGGVPALPYGPGSETAATVSPSLAWT